ncbi:MAG: undecaprenyl-diphosphate phosphatase [Planctomycetota bacterium]
MSFLAAILLGIVQGVAEFLPISSSGHLAILGRGEEAFGLYAIVMFHLGTLLAIVAYYFRDVRDLALGGLRLAAAVPLALVGKKRLSALLETDVSARTALLVIVASIPTAAIGLLLRDWAEYLATPGRAKFVGACFIITAVLVFLCDRLPAGFKGIGGAGFHDALMVGMFQGVAVLPGLSRSGLTIFAGVLGGIERRDAARFSFLAAIPAMIGALMLEAAHGAPRGDVLPALVGAAVAFGAGYLSIVLLVRLLALRKFRFFAAYLLVIGTYVIIRLN